MQKYVFNFYKILNCYILFKICTIKEEKKIKERVQMRGVRSYNIRLIEIVCHHKIFSRLHTNNIVVIYNLQCNCIIIILYLYPSNFLKRIYRKTYKMVSQLVVRGVSTPSEYSIKENLEKVYLTSKLLVHYCSFRF